MNYEIILERLKSYQVPGDWPPTIFLLPEVAMKDIYDCIVENKLSSGIELGTGHGATSCVIAAAMEEIGGGRLVTIDKTLHMPANVNVLKEHSGIGDNLEFVLEPLGYNWYLADLIAKQTSDDFCAPIFDFCLIDGAHEFEPDALAFTLVAKLLKPGAWVVLDDLNFYLRSMSFWRETHGHLSDRELDTCQIGMVWDYLVKQRPDFTDFRITDNGRVGWTRKAASDSHVDGARTMGSLTTQTAEKDWLVRSLQSSLAQSETQLARIKSTLGWRLLSIYGRRIKYPYLLPLYRMLGLGRSASESEPAAREPIREACPPPPARVISERASAEDQGRRAQPDERPRVEHGQGGLRIDLGCGSVKKEGTIGIDVEKTPAVDCVLDIEKEPLPFPDRSVSYVHSSHFLEHTADPGAIFAEISRVCANNARLELWTPYAWSNDAFVLDHKNFFTEDIYRHVCIWFFDFWEKILHARWLLNEIQYVIDARTLCYMKAKGIHLDFALRHMQNVAKEFCAHITVVHGNPQAPSPRLRRTFSIDRFGPRFELRADELAPDYQTFDAKGVDAPPTSRIEEAIRTFASGEGWPPV